MKKSDIIDYLQENCICNPEDLKTIRSVCGISCRAKWHWWLEFERAKIEYSLPMRFNPVQLSQNPSKEEKE